MQFISYPTYETRAQFIVRYGVRPTTKNIHEGNENVPPEFLHLCGEAYWIERATGAHQNNHEVKINKNIFNEMVSIANSYEGVRVSADMGINIIVFECKVQAAYAKPHEAYSVLYRFSPSLAETYKEYMSTNFKEYLG